MESLLVLAGIFQEMLLELIIWVMEKKRKKKEKQEGREKERGRERERTEGRCLSKASTSDDFSE